MQEMIKLVTVIKKEIETLRREISKMIKTHAQILTDEWIDGPQAQSILKISPRTLQNYRDNGLLPFSQIKGKIYFKIADVEDLLNKNYNNK